jgi:hypothetical protein
MTNSPSRLKRPVELAIQRAVVQWALQLSFPGLLITVTSNESHYRDTQQIGQLGIQDVLVFVPRGGVLSVLFLELKTKIGSLSDAQIEWNSEFDKRYSWLTNVRRDVAYGFTDAKRIIATFLSGE